MDQEHTAETWTAFQESEDIGTNYWRIRFNSPHGGVIHGYCNKRRARLIAAAPDLLHTLKTIRAVDIPLPYGLLDQVTGVIAKAEGTAHT